MTMEDGVKYRLGLDLGTNSIGWAAVSLDENGEPCGVLDMGVRVFPDGRKDSASGDGPSNAERRREARGQRRRRVRYKRRRADFMKALIDCGLMPREECERKALEQLDPYQLRASALNMKLPTHQVGRALFHLNQGRGFKSNRKTEKGEKDTGPVKEATKRLDEQLSASDARTLGELLYLRRYVGDPVRFRNQNQGTNLKAEYELYPTREMISDEVDKIWAAQEKHHPGVMTEDAKNRLRGIIFRQRDTVSPPVGKCTLDPASDNEDEGGFRCAWAHPLAQRFRIWQEVRNLEVQETGRRWRRLTNEEGDTVAQALLEQNKVTFNKIRKLLGLSSDVYFNLESEKRKELLGDATAAKLSHKDLFGKSWRKLPPDKQIAIVDLLLGDKDDAAAIEWLTKHAELNTQGAERVMSAFLPDGHCRLGLRAIKKILPHMEGGLDYPSAARATGYDHARAPTGELSPDGRLPHYGEWLKDHLAGSGDPQDPPDKRWGRYPNPTVHIGLGQLRRVVNALIEGYGTPHQIVVEVVRDLKRSKKEREKIRIEQAANQKKNEARDREIRDLGSGLRPSYENRLRMRLWEELNPKNVVDRRCPYSGKPISIGQLFSAEVEIDHLIPWQDSWDDSPANKVVCFRSANREKGKSTPYEKFGKTPEWEGIALRASKLPYNKRWRFGADARKRFERQDGFLARQLNETAWLSRLAKEYLSAVVRPNNIWVTPGRLTSMIRHKWGLNELLPGYDREAKKRTDHRHHAIDALVVALTDRSLLQHMSGAYDETRSRIIVPPPWEGFDRDQLRPFLDDMVVSYKPDHGTPGKQGSTSGQLHNETAYGLIEELKGGWYKVVVRKEVSDLSLPSLPKDLDSFKGDVDVKDALKALWEEVQAEGGDAFTFADRAANEGVVDKKGRQKTVKRARILRDLDSVHDTVLRNALLELWERVRAQGGGMAKFAEKAASEGAVLNGRRQPVRRVRIVDEQRVIPIRHGPGNQFSKGYLPDSNEFADVWRMRDGTLRLVAVPTFCANQRDLNIENFRPLTSKGKYKGRPDPVAKQIMRLRINDMGALGSGPDPRIVRVRKITDAKAGAFVVLDDQNEANVPDRVGKDMKENRYRASKLREEGFRVVQVNEIGRVLDPGPPKP